jgi:short subunit fatty acids transporter
MNTKKLILYIVGIIILVIIIWFAFANKIIAPQKEITSFDECAAAGNPIMESYPAKCMTQDKKSFTQDIGNELEKTDLIKINSPRPNAIVGNTIEINGEARGTWFFEASFPIKLVDEAGNELATTVAQATSDWMTENFVPFKATIEFQNTGIKKANLMLIKDNPSGLPENDDFLRVPIKFE